MAHKKATTLIPLAAAERLLKQGGAERVSDDAKKALVQVLEEAGKEIGKRATLLSEHAGRKTVQEKDVMLARQ